MFCEFLSSQVKEGYMEEFKYKKYVYLVLKRTIEIQNKKLIEFKKNDDAKDKLILELKEELEREKAYKKALFNRLLEKDS